MPQQVDQRPVEPLGMGVRLGEQPGDDPRAEPPIPGVPHGFATEHPQEVRLAGPVGPEHRQPLAVEDLGGERLHQAGQLEVLGDDRAHRRPAAAQPHGHVLFLGLVRRRFLGLEPGQPGLHRPVARGHVR